MKIRLFLAILLFLQLNSYLIGQISCRVGNNCGIEPFGFADFKPFGSSVFCETEMVVLENASTFSDFDYFIVDWGDEFIDTISTYDNVTHFYDFSGLDRCTTGAEFGRFISFVGIKECGNQISCSGGTQQIFVKLKPAANFNYDTEVCIRNVARFSNSSCNDDPEDYLWNFGDGQVSTEENPDHEYMNPGQYNVSLQVSNRCGSDRTTRIIKIVDDPKADFSFTSDQAGLCIPSIVSLKNQSNQFSRITWQITPPFAPDSPWCFNDTLQTLSTNDIDIILKEAREYTVSIRAVNDCGNDILTETFMAIDQPSARLSAPNSFCEIANYTPNVSFLNTTGITSVLWSFPGGNPTSSIDLNPRNIVYNQPGKYPITLVVNSPCGDSTYSTEIEVLAKVLPEIKSTKTEYCANEGPDTLTVNVSGGRWTGIGIIDRDLGIFNPAAVTPGATVMIRYDLVNANCSGSDEIFLTVKEAEALSINTLEFCLTDPPTILTSNLSGGIWTGPGIDSQGVFSPLEAGNGLHEISYGLIGQNGCISTTQADILVQDFPQGAPVQSVSFCRTPSNLNLNQLYQINPSPGVTIEWSGPGIINSSGIFNSTGIDSNIVELYIEFSNQNCQLTDTVDIILEELPTLKITPDTTVCIAETSFQLSANVPGGRWNGKGINPDSGIINVIDAGNGSNNYFYVVNEGTSCELIGTTTIKILDLGINLTAGSDASFCASAGIVQISGGSPSGGFWRGDNGLVDSASGTIDVNLLQSENTYIFEYCIKDSAVNGCEACASKQVTINPMPIPDFDIAPVICIDSKTQLINNSIFGTTFIWDLGNGTSTTGFEPEISFTDVGSYTITMKATSTFGCSSSTTNDVEIVQLPIAAFSLDELEGCAPFEIVISDQSVGYDKSVEWLLDMESIEITDLQNYIIDSIENDSIFIITQSASNLCGTIQASKSINVLARPFTNFGFEMDEACSPARTTFSNTTIGNPLTYRWNLGNGTMLVDSQPPAQIYVSIGDLPTDYNISLITENACATDTFQQILTVNPPNVSAFIQLDSVSACPPFSLQLKNFSTPGSITSWEWISETGRRASSTQHDPNIVFDEEGVYTIILSASQCGTDKDTAFIEALPRPAASFSVPPSICLGDTVTVENSSNGGRNYEWSFGDGLSSTLDIPIHHFDIPGVYDIRMIVYNDFNCSDTLVQSINVFDLPEFNIENMPLFGCPPFEVVINNNSEDINNFSWITTDDQTSNLKNPKFVFPNSGTYFIKGTATDQNGCRTLLNTEAITIYPKPKANFSLKETELCSERDTIIATNRTIGTNTYTWFLDDMALSNSIHLRYPLLTSGDKTISLLATNAFNCTDSLAKFIHIDDIPSIFPEELNIDACKGEIITIRDLENSAEEYLWMITGFPVLSGGTVSFISDTIGRFDLSGVARNGLTCQDSILIQGFLNIYDTPIADFAFTVDPDPRIIGDVLFENRSSNFTDVRWSFGDGAISSENNPLHIYNINRPDSVLLVAINDNNGQKICRDEIAKLIKPEPISTFYAPNALSPDNGTPEVQVFKPVGLGIIEYNISIYSPWGEIIWYSEALQNGQPAESWDGRLPSGKDAPQGVYIYKATITFENEKRSETGAVHLIR